MNGSSNTIRLLLPNQFGYYFQAEFYSCSSASRRDYVAINYSAVGKYVREHIGNRLMGSIFARKYSGFLQDGGSCTDAGNLLSGFDVPAEI